MRKTIAILIMVATAATAQTNHRLATEAYASWKADIARSNAAVYTDAKIAALPPATNATAISGGALAQATNVAEAVVAAAAPTLAVASAATVTGAQSNLIASAWQNPANAEYWTWTSNGKEITLTGYSGPAAVVIPDMLDGLPVTGFGTIFAGDPNITSVSGGQFITEISDSAFEYATSLTTANFPQATTIGDSAFEYATSLTTANFPQATTIGNSAFSGTSLTTANFPQVTTIGDGAFEATSLATANFPQATTIGYGAFGFATSLTTANFPQVTEIGDYAFTGTPLTTANFPQATSIGDYAFDSSLLAAASFPQATTIGDYAFIYSSLTSLYLGQNAPAEASDVFEETPNVTVYVTDPTATGYGATWNGRPVVRMPLFGDTLTLKGTNIEDRITAKVNAAAATADTKYVAKAGFPAGGCKDLGTATNLVIDGTSIYYTAAPASAYTITVSQPVSSGYTYCLTTYSDSPITLVNADLRNDWVLGGTNTLVFYPGTTNRWLVKGSAP